MPCQPHVWNLITTPTLIRSSHCITTLVYTQLPRTCCRYRIFCNTIYTKPLSLQPNTPSSLPSTYGTPFKLHVPWRPSSRPAARFATLRSLRILLLRSDLRSSSVLALPPTNTTSSLCIQTIWEGRGRMQLVRSSAKVKEQTLTEPR